MATDASPYSHGDEWQLAGFEPLLSKKS
jgi:hypothetical protein